MNCIHYLEVSDAGFGTGYKCELSGEANPDCSNCEDHAEPHPCDGCEDMSDCTLPLTPDMALKLCDRCKRANRRFLI